MSTEITTLDDLLDDAFLHYVKCVESDIQNPRTDAARSIAASVLAIAVIMKEDRDEKRAEAKANP